MKHSIMKVMIIVLMVSCCFGLFANPGTEIASVFSSNSTDSTSSIDNTIINNYIKELEDYQSQYEKYSVSMQMAYNKSDADAYLEAKKALRSLVVPEISKEDTETAVKQIVKNNDVESAKLLFQYSRYYRPVLTLVASSDGMSYSSTITVLPGSEISLPSLKTANRAMNFIGWGVEEGVVTYPAGEKLQMPLEDTTLYAVFELDANQKQGASVDINIEDANLVLKKNQKTNFTFNVKNDGTEDLSEVEVTLESDDPLLIVLDEKLTTRFLESYGERTANYTVISKAAAGTQLKALITVKDSNDNIWTKEITFIVE